MNDAATPVPDTERLRVAVASCHFDDEIQDLEALLERYHAMTGWAEAVASAGAAVTVFQRFKQEAQLRRGSVNYRFVADHGPGAVPAWSPARPLMRAVKDADPSVVHVDGLIYPAFVRCLRGGLSRRAAIVVQDHGGIRAPSRGLRHVGRRLLYGIGLRGADAFLFTSREQATPWRDAGIMRPHQVVHQIPESSTNMSAWTMPPAGRSALEGSPALLWVGRLEGNKDPLTILDGFARIAARLPRATLTMVYGEDELLPAVKAWISLRPEIGARVHLKGRLDRTALPALYSAADIFVLGSHREVACFSLIEALSFGVTPIVTDIPAFRVLTNEGAIGMLFRPGDAGAMARAIDATCQGDPSVRRAEVLSHFERKLSWRAIGAQALTAYRTTALTRSRAMGVAS